MREWIDHADSSSGAPDASDASLTHGSRLSLQLNADALRRFDPLQWLTSLVAQHCEILPEKTKLYTVLSEIYHNALDHGVLGLDSTMKRDANGFQDYVDRRASLLSQLQHGWIRLTIGFVQNGNIRELHIYCQDSGPGYSWPAAADIDSTVRLHGRGLSLLRELCAELAYDNQSNTLHAVYRFQ